MKCVTLFYGHPKLLTQAINCFKKIGTSFKPRYIVGMQRLMTYYIIFEFYKNISMNNLFAYQKCLQ